MRKKYLVAVAVLLAAAALAWLLVVKTSSKPPRILASIEVEGRGSVLANGTFKAFWNSTKPFALRLEAVPEKCWAFKGWLVNGSPYSSQPNATLTVKGNTTVKAVFERPVYAVSIVANASGALARVNGTLYPLPVNVSAPACSLLEVEPLESELCKPLSSSALIAVEHPLRLVLYYARKAFAVELKSVLVPVSVNGTIYARDALVAVPPGSNLTIAPYGTDPAGCTPYNETHRVCLVGWRVDGTEKKMRYLFLHADRDVVLEQLTTFAVREPPQAKTVIETPSGPIEVEVVPAAKWMIVPFKAEEYRHVGGGWFHIKGEDWVFYIALPPWKRVRVTLNYTSPGRVLGGLKVVVRNDEIFAALGWWISPRMTEYVKLASFTIDYAFVERYRNISTKEDAWRAFGDSAYSQLFQPPPELIANNLCDHMGSGPSTKVMEGIGVGWLRIEGSGEMWIRIEVLEPQG
jgi:hypothetical protein